MMQFNTHIFPKTKGTYIVGGSIRDLILGRTPTDFDIVVTGNAEIFAEKMAARTTGHFIRLGKVGHTMFRVLAGDHIFDITPLNGTSIEEDLKKRDFNINAMAYDLVSGEIIDCMNGLKDLAEKKVRMVSKEIFRRDPVRLIRAYRIAADLNFEIELGTASVLKTNAQQIRHSAGERVRDEFFKLLGTSKSHGYLTQMAGSNLLTAIFPELERLKGCRQNNNHQYDVFEHTIKAYGHLETLLNDPKQILPESSFKLVEYMGGNKAVLLKCAILLHDIGKPPAKTLDNGGESHFYGHARKSGDMVQIIGQRLRFSKHQMQFIDFIVRNHLKPLFLFMAREDKTLTQKRLTRFYKKCSDNTPALLLHTLADIKAKHEKLNHKNKSFISFVKTVLHDYFYTFRPLSHEPRLITGHDLIQVFGLEPSPLFKTVLNLVDEERLTKRIKNRTQALSLVRDYLGDKG